MSDFMGRAVELAQQGWPAPNPRVGCVIVKDGLIVGEGYCAYAGAPHAEAMALASAGELARGATAYVTLEPCNHFGRTPPCSQALVRAGVAKVVIAVPDPNPVAAGGARALEASGITVEFKEYDSTRYINRQFLFAMRERRPLVTGKTAISLDGRVALASGKSRWITSIEAQYEAHRLRAQTGVVLVGRGTVETDDPELTVRLDSLFERLPADGPQAHHPPSPVKNQPLRVVLDPGNRLSTNYKVFNDKAPTLHITGNIVLADLLFSLFERGHIGLLVEGGPNTLSRFIDEDLVDELVIFQSPKLLGNGPTWYQNAENDSLQGRAQFGLPWLTKKLGDDRSMKLLASRLGEDPLFRPLP